MSSSIRNIPRIASRVRGGSCLLSRQQSTWRKYSVLAIGTTASSSSSSSSSSSFRFPMVIGGGSICQYEDMEEQRRKYHTSVPTERAVAIILGLGALSAGSYAAASGIKAYKEWKASLPPEEPVEEVKAEEQEETDNKKKGGEETNGGPRGNIFAKWFGVGVGAKYYDGGFEEVMTRREAALILGVRESSPPNRIKEAHRKLLILNHPDTGGSTYIAGKINEAKELLLKGRARTM